jgi:hypothetical protein
MWVGGGVRQTNEKQKN